MNTFLPSNDFEVCAKTLDPDRLSRQITEVPTIARTLLIYQIVMDHNGRQLPWGVQFPSILKLWTTEGGVALLPELKRYHQAMHREWLALGRPTHKGWTNFNWDSILPKRDASQVVWPESVHESHRSKLYSKDAGYYKRAFDRMGLPAAIPGLSYSWECPTLCKALSTSEPTLDMPRSW